MGEVNFARNIYFHGFYYYYFFGDSKEVPSSVNYRQTEQLP